MGFGQAKLFGTKTDRGLWGSLHHPPRNGVWRSVGGVGFRGTTPGCDPQAEGVEGPLACSDSLLFATFPRFSEIDIVSVLLPSHLPAKTRLSISEHKWPCFPSYKKAKRSR